MASTVQKLDPWGSIDDLSPGDAALRRAIALRYLADGLTVPVDDIIITNGALDALNLCLSAVTRPGDAVIVESPTFYAALQSLERNQLHAIEVATHPREGIDLDALAQAIVRHKPRACWLMTTFQNPLGSLMPDAKKEALVKLLTPRRGADRGRRLRRTLFRRQAPAPGQGLRPRGDRDALFLVLEDAGAGLPGRLGRRRRYTRRIMRNKLTTSLATAAPTRPPSPPTWRKAASIATCASSASSWPCNRARCCRPWRGIFPRAPCHASAGRLLHLGELPERIDTLQLHRAALGHGISIAPGPLFSATGGFGNFLRLNYGHPWNGGLDRAWRRWAS